MNMRGTNLTVLLVQQTAIMLVTAVLALWVEYGIVAVAAMQQFIAVTISPENVSLVAPQEHWVECSCTVGVYGSGALVAGILGLVFIGLFTLYAPAAPWIRVFFMVLGCQLTLRLLAGVGASIVGQEGLFVSMRWLYWPGSLQTMVAIIGGIALFALGFIIRKKWFIALAYTEDYLKKRHVVRDAVLLGLMPAWISIGVLWWLLGFDRVEGLQLAVYALGWLLLFIPIAGAGHALSADAFLFPDEEDGPPYRFHLWLIVVVVMVAAALWWALL